MNQTLMMMLIFLDIATLVLIKKITMHQTCSLTIAHVPTALLVSSCHLQ